MRKVRQSHAQHERKEESLLFFCVVCGVALIGITFVPDSARTDVYTVDTFRRLAGGKGLDLFFFFLPTPYVSFQEELLPKEGREKNDKPSCSIFAPLCFLSFSPDMRAKKRSEC